MTQRYRIFQDWSAIHEEAKPQLGVHVDSEGKWVYYVDHKYALDAKDDIISMYEARLLDQKRYIEDLENTCSDLEREVSQLERDLERSQEYFTNEESKRWR